MQLHLFGSVCRTFFFTLSKQLLFESSNPVSNPIDAKTLLIRAQQIRIDEG